MSEYSSLEERRDIRRQKWHDATRDYLDLDKWPDGPDIPAISDKHGLDLVSFTRFILNKNLDKVRADSQLARAITSPTIRMKVITKIDSALLVVTEEVTGVAGRAYVDLIKGLSEDQVSLDDLNPEEEDSLLKMFIFTGGGGKKKGKTKRGKGAERGGEGEEDGETAEELIAKLSQFERRLFLEKVRRKILEDRALALTTATDGYTRFANSIRDLGKVMVPEDKNKDGFAPGTPVIGDNNAITQINNIISNITVQQNPENNAVTVDVDGKSSTVATQKVPKRIPRAAAPARTDRIPDLFKDVPSDPKPGEVFHEEKPKNVFDALKKLPKEQTSSVDAMERKDKGSLF